MKKKTIKLFVLVLIGLIIFLNNTVYASEDKKISDVGSFESYSSGGGSGGSGWDSGGSSWGSESSSGYGSSSYDHDGSSSGISGIRLTGGKFEKSDYLLANITCGILIGLIILFFIYLSVLSIKFKKKNKEKENEQTIEKEKKDTELTWNIEKLTDKEDNRPIDEWTENKIKERNPNFSILEFTRFAGKLFANLQMAWTQRNWEVIRMYETPELFEQHSKQLQEYIDRHQINVLEDISIISSNFLNYDYDSRTGTELLNVVVMSRMKDYIIDDVTNALVKGDKNLYHVNRYKMTFVKQTDDLNSTNREKTIKCPNCGAPMKVTASGRCSYCNGIITMKDFNWVLLNLERLK